MLGGAAARPAAPHPHASPKKLGLLRTALAAASFTGEGVRAALRTESGFLATTVESAVHERRLAEAEPALAALIRLFVLNLGVPVDRVEQDLAPVGAELLVELGLAEVTAGELVPCLRLVPNGELVIASDLGSYVQPDHAASVHRPSVTLASLTVRRRVARALDVGTGTGFQALLASSHCDRVVATDLNERALAFAEFNAALNGRTNIEFRAGSFFEPVQGEAFDLVVSNPPYVISPETALVFRDSGKPGDTVSAELVSELPAYLHEDGFGTIMISWAAGDDAAARPRSWVDGRGCDAWLIHTGGEDALHAAATWNRAAGTDPEGFAQHMDAWVAYYEKLGIGWIAYGALVLRRRAGGSNWFRAAELPEDRLRPASSHLLQMFAAQELTERVLDVPLALVETAFVDRTARVVDGAWNEVSATVRLEAGIGFGVNLDPIGARLVVLFDGRAPLRPQLPALARELGVPEEKLEAFATRLAMHLLEHGLVS
jgi:Methyltransferase small domain